jgi:Mrp family chromosome partitioning ATPase
MTGHNALMSRDASPLHDAAAEDEAARFRRLAAEASALRVPPVPVFAPRHDLAPPRPTRAPYPPLALRLAPPDPARMWESLAPVALDPRHLAGNALFPEPGDDTAHRAFDVLRTRTAQAMADQGWRRLAVTSPTAGCGKSFVAANLALSLARRPGSRIVLLDADLRRPALADLFGVAEPGPLRAMLAGEQPIESHLRRAGPSLALALNDTPAADAAEVLAAADSAGAIAALVETLAPEMVVLDLPPALVGDDVLAALALFDAVLLVADGTRTTAEDIRRTERLFEGRVPILGVVLNRAQDFEHLRSRFFGRGRR